MKLVFAREFEYHIRNVLTLPTYRVPARLAPNLRKLSPHRIHLAPTLPNTMALLVDKHRPRTLETLSYHPELSERLRSLAASGDFPHLLIYGPSGAGKKTRIQATLRALYGPGAEKIKIDSRVFQTTR